MSVTNYLMDPIDLAIDLTWQWDPSIVWLHILQNIFFCVQHKKEIHTSLEQLEGE